MRLDLYLVEKGFFQTRNKAKLAIDENKVFVNGVNKKASYEVLESDNIEFEKLVINQSRTKYLKMKNVSEVNCKWALTGLEQLPPVFKIEPVSGIIEKGKEISIAVTFSSDKQDRICIDNRKTQCR